MDNPPQISSPSEASLTVSQPGSGCTVHPSVAATFSCKDCGRNFCQTCGFDERDGSKVCTECMTRRLPAPRSRSVPSSGNPASPELAQQMAEKSIDESCAALACPDDWTEEALKAAKAELHKRNLAEPSAENSTPPPLLNTIAVRAGLRCAQHAHVQATQQCKLCGAFMCPTCDFSFADDIHLCPTCVSKSDDGLSPRRKKYLIGSYALAAWSTLGMTCVFAGAFSGMAESKEGTMALGWIFLLFIFGPAVAGLSLGLNTRSKQTSNPAIWIAIVWNVILVVSFLILMVIGATSR